MSVLRCPRMGDARHKDHPEGRHIRLAMHQLRPRMVRCSTNRSNCRIIGGTNADTPLDESDHTSLEVSSSVN
jgi:endonuclease I